MVEDVGECFSCFSDMSVCAVFFSFDVFPPAKLFKEFVLKVLKTRPMSLVYKRMRKFKRVFGTTVSAYEK